MICLSYGESAEMLFNSLAYMIFLPVVVLLFWSCPLRLRVPLLLIASYVFYMSWKPVYGLLILGLTVANFLFGVRVAKEREKSKRWLIFSIAFNLVVLGFFKYTYFALDMCNQVIAPFGAHLSSPVFQIILPLGISFFVFEFIHYLVDIHRGSQPVKSFIDFALFASFFPTQIAGPIKRYQDFIPQLSAGGKFSFQYMQEGVELILWGLFKKVLFADNFAVVVNAGFAHPDLLSSCDLWLIAYAFAFQIYFDFSGYTDIARGSASLLGYKVPQNFNLPYLAGSVADFWHRWHISLSTWLRDYLYIPLGGNRFGRWFNYRNLFLTMALGGLWHGAALHFLVWGAYQGMALILHKLYREMTATWQWLENARKMFAYRTISVIVTFHVICIGWIFFRAETMSAALQILTKMLFLPDATGKSDVMLTLVNVQEPVIFMVMPFIVLLLLLGQLIAGAARSLPETFVLPVPLKALAIAVCLSLLIVFSPDTSPKFIYFQF